MDRFIDNSDVVDDLDYSTPKKLMNYSYKYFNLPQSSFQIYRT